LLDIELELELESELKLLEVRIVPAVLNSGLVLDDEVFQPRLLWILLAVLRGSLLLAETVVALMFEVWLLVDVDEGRVRLRETAVPMPALVIADTQSMAKKKVNRAFAADTDQLLHDCMRIIS